MDTSSRVPIVIDSRRPDIFGLRYWRELAAYRELMLVLAWRDISVRYKQTWLGAAWVVIRPLLLLLILTFVFNKVAGLRGEQGTPYVLLVLCGLLPWQYFANTFADASNSLVNNAALVTKVYFPRLLVPAASLLAGLLDWLLAFLLLIVFMAWYGQVPGWQILLLPLFLSLVVAFTAGAAIFFAALNVRYRDVRLIVPFIVQLGLYLSPVGYAMRDVPEDWRWLFLLNPMVGIIDGFRWCLLESASPPAFASLMGSVMATFVLLWLSLRYFAAVEREFADAI